MKKVLITGATGSTGSNAIKKITRSEGSGTGFGS
jgi:FlaA1/EpsC-like NDP-sugar epimerase